MKSDNSANTDQPTIREVSKYCVADVLSIFILYGSVAGPSVCTEPRHTIDVTTHIMSKNDIENKTNDATSKNEYIDDENND